MSVDPDINKERRCFLVKSAAVLGGIGVACAIAPLASSLLPSAKVEADNAPVTVDIGHLQPGEQMTVAWRGKPVWIVRRTAKMLQDLSTHIEQLRDPDSMVNQQPPYAKNTHRSIYPDYLVLVGVCTHLGCTPKYKPNAKELASDWSGGFFCPCHGSTFDMAGRVYKSMPAPINLAVPPHRFLNAHTLVIGENAV